MSSEIRGKQLMPRGGPDTVHWGYFEAALSPRLIVDSGDLVTISTVSGMPEQMPKEPLVVPPALRAIHAGTLRKMGAGRGHSVFCVVHDLSESGSHFSDHGFGSGNVAM
jgi:hypothetical protein